MAQVTTGCIYENALSGLPDHERMQIVAENLHRGRARQSFDPALYAILGTEDPPSEGNWLHPATQRSGASWGYAEQPRPRP